MTETVTDLLADIEPVVRGWIQEQIGDNANSNIPGDQFEFEFSLLADGDFLFYNGVSFEWNNTRYINLANGPNYDLTLDPPAEIIYLEGETFIESQSGTQGDGHIDSVHVNAIHLGDAVAGDGTTLTFGAIADDSILFSEFAAITMEVVDPATASKDAKLLHQIMIADSRTTILEMRAAGSITNYTVGVGTGAALTPDRWLDIDGSLSAADENYGALISPSLGADNQPITAVYARADVDDNMTATVATGIRIKDARLGAGAAATLVYALHIEEQTAGGTNYSIVFDPGSDKDMNIFSIDVTGTPTVIWDESEDRIDISHGLAIQGASIIDVTSTEALLVRKNADGGDVFVVDTTNTLTAIGGATEAGRTLKVHGQVMIEGPVDTNNNFIFQNVGAPAANKVQWSWSTRDNNEDLWLFGYDGTDFKNLIKTDFSNGYIYFDGGNVGIQTATPSEELEVVGDIKSTRFGIGTGGIPSYNLHINIDVDDYLSYMHNDGNAAAAGGLWIDTRWNVATNYPFRVTTNSQAVEILNCEGTGRVGIGKLGGLLGKTHIDQSSASGAIPVLFLDQGDASEQAILISYNGADVDMILIDVDVTGDPQFRWSETPDVFTLNKGLAVGDAGVTNYANFAGDGELTLFGTARVTSQIPIDNANLGKGNTAPTQIIIGDYNSWEYDINDDTVFTFHIPHDWAAGTAITISIDWFIDQAYVTNSGEVKWQIVWAATPHDASEPLDGPTHTGTADTGDINIPAIAKAIKEDGLTIAGASLSTEDQVGVTISRIALTDGNNPSGNVDPAIVDIHIQYIADKLGENT